MTISSGYGCLSARGLLGRPFQFFPSLEGLGQVTLQTFESLGRRCDGDFVLLVEVRLRHGFVKFGLLGFHAFDLLGEQFEFFLFFEAESTRFGDGFCPCGLGLRRFGGGVGHGCGQSSLHQPIVVATRVVLDDSVALEYERIGGHFVEKSTIVADEQHGAGVFNQQVFEKFERFGVEVVGRFVEDQDV